jgi:hypothetical protein
MVGGIRQNAVVEESQPSDIGGSLSQLGAAMGNQRSRQNIAAIDQKMADAACDLAHMPAASSKRTGAELEQCVATCQKVTGNDAAACFKDCAQ